MLFLNFFTQTTGPFIKYIRLDALSRSLASTSLSFLDSMDSLEIIQMKRSCHPALADSKFAQDLTQDFF